MEEHDQGLNRWMPVVYDELRRRADGLFRRQRPGHTLQPTALVHEVFVRLAKKEDLQWESKTHFMAYAARAMHNILIDHVRKPRVPLARVTLSGIGRASESRDVDPGELLDAIEKLAALNERHASVVVFRFFAGMKVKEVAEHLGVSSNTVEKDWTFARSWLLNQLEQVE